jgi:hypothetical protein
MIPGVPPDLAHLLNRPRPLSPDGGAPRAEAAVAAGKKSAISIISRKSST